MEATPTPAQAFEPCELFGTGRREEEDGGQPPREGKHLHHCCRPPVKSSPYHATKGGPSGKWECASVMGHPSGDMRPGPSRNKFLLT